jgi:acetyltransferase-like isoleucine patch superfamily enzyme
VIHPTAEVERGAVIGANTRIWNQAHVRAGAVIGADCTLGYGVYVDDGVVIGDKVKLQNRVSIYRGVTLEDGVFVGPHATFTNDKHPRSIKPDGALISREDWTPAVSLVKYGASIGAGAVVLCGVTIGRWAMVGANALVTEDVPDQGLVVGAPARLVGYACRCGQALQATDKRWLCPECGSSYKLPPLRGAAGAAT